MCTSGVCKSLCIVSAIPVYTVPSKVARLKEMSMGDVCGLASCSRAHLLGENIRYIMSDPSLLSMLAGLAADSYELAVLVGHEGSLH